jgi:hypothetical protein
MFISKTPHSLGVTLYFEFRDVVTKVAKNNNFFAIQSDEKLKKDKKLLLWIFNMNIQPTIFCSCIKFLGFINLGS